MFLKGFAASIWCFLIHFSPLSQHFSSFHLSSLEVNLMGTARHLRPLRSPRGPNFSVFNPISVARLLQRGISSFALLWTPAGRWEWDCGSEQIAVPPATLSPRLPDVLVSKEGEWDLFPLPVLSTNSCASRERWGVFSAKKRFPPRETHPEIKLRARG